MMINTKVPYGSVNEKSVVFLTVLPMGNYAVVDCAGNQSIIDEDVFIYLKDKGYSIKEVKKR